MHRLCALVFLAAALRAASPAVEVPAAVLEDKIRGGVLGQIIGDLNGLVHENKYILEPGKVESYVPALPKGAWSDDDTDIEWIYLIEMERTGRLIIPFPRIAELWKKHINRQIWCSHKYLRQLLDIGIEPPLTGSSAVNPWASFNLSGQFVSETWGMIAPGMPRTAATMALHYVSTSVDGEPLQSAQMFSAMIATAYLTSDMERILDAGAAAVDAKSEMRHVIDDVRAWHRGHPDDWRAARRKIQMKYSIHPERVYQPDMNGVKLNGACTILALEYGKGDFVETIRHAFNCGWDADNNAATSGTVIGVIKGYKWMMDRGWNIEDRFRNTSRDAVEDETITRYSDRLVKMARVAIKEQGGEASVGRKTWRIRTQAAGNMAPLDAASAQLQTLRARLAPEIARGVASPRSQEEAARAAYLAIALDMAGPVAAKNAEGWRKAIAALGGYGSLMQVLFHDSAADVGSGLRQRAVAAGLVAPAPPPKKK